jgi:Fe-S-cluster containining protein
LEEETLDPNIPILLPENSMYQCVGCCTCCRDWMIFVDPRTLNKLKETEFPEKFRGELGIDDIFVKCPESSEFQMTKNNDNCIALDGTKCRIHSELGPEYKPLGCRAFPFFAHSTPDGIHIGTSFMCKSIRDNTGISIDNYLEEIKDFISQFKIKELGENIILADEIKLDWEGYKILENFILKKINMSLSDSAPENYSIGDAFFEIFMQLIMLVLKCRMDSINKISAKGIDFILNNPVELPFPRDEMFRQQEVHYTLMLVAIFEGLKTHGQLSKLEELMSDGEIKSALFNKTINIQSLWNYAYTKPCSWKKKEFARYINHLIWQKFLLQKDNILKAIVEMSLAYPFFEWYMYCFAFARNAEKPVMEDTRSAISLLDMNIKHANIDYFSSISEVFCDSLIKQVKIYIDDYVPEGYSGT